MFEGGQTLHVCSEGQETGAIVPAPENARKKFGSVVDHARKLFF
jgi:hypothetical protein